MANLDLYNMQGNVVGKIELSDDVFGVEINEHVLHSAVVTYLANQRQGTKSALTRAEVRGGGAKPRPQKGSGRSRQGSIRSPQWVGGGVAFAPKPRDFSLKINKKVKRLAMKSALTSKVADNKIIVLEDLKLDAVKTKDMIKILDNLKTRRALIVIEDNNENIVLSARNIEGVKTASVQTISPYDILKYDSFIVTKNAALKIQEVYA